MPRPETHLRASHQRAPNERRWDALVIGGGPAGLAAAIALRGEGLDVLVADALTPPIDKACGEGLMPDSRQALARLGIEFCADEGREFSGIHFASRNAGHNYLATADFTTGKGIGVRRLRLHQRLVDRAEEIGVRLRWGVCADLRASGEVMVGGEPCSYRYLIGADGQASRLRRWAGLDAGSLRSERFGFRRHYRMRPWENESAGNAGCYVEVHWASSGQAYVTPVGEEEVCVAVVTRTRGLDFDRVLADFPHLQAKLHGQPVMGRDRGAVTTTRSLPRVTRSRIALIGDASGTADAVTGEGLASAFRQALLLGASLGRDTTSEYEAGHTSTLRMPQTMASILLMMDRWDWLRDRAMRTLSANPSIFARLLAVHVGEEHLAHFVATGGVRLALGLLHPLSRTPAPNSASKSQTGDVNFQPGAALLR